MERSKICVHCVGIVALFLTTASPAKAVTELVSNLREPSSTGVVGFNNVVIEAGSFTTGQMGALLEEASAEISANQGTSLFAEIRVDQDRQPGMLISNLGTINLMQTGIQTVSFTAGRSERLDPFMTYWLVIGTLSDGANWYVTDSQASYSPIGWTINERTQSNDGGLTWLLPRHDNLLKFRIAGSVPEPHSWTVIGMAVLTSASWVVWKKKRLFHLP